MTSIKRKRPPKKCHDCKKPRQKKRLTLCRDCGKPKLAFVGSLEQLLSIEPT